MHLQKYQIHVPQYTPPNTRYQTQVGIDDLACMNCLRVEMGERACYTGEIIINFSLLSLLHPPLPHKSLFRVTLSLQKPHPPAKLSKITTPFERFFLSSLGRYFYLKGERVFEMISAKYKEIKKEKCEYFSLRCLWHVWRDSAKPAMDVPSGIF